eukprot:GHVU01074270.1.p2 GENE.GHVU01074270.1~~GHVU01074270.1.p2  ORF type:complete len:192 (+),score=11.95 GHVU01074270.1:1942-2517(+)
MKPEQTEHCKNGLRFVVAEALRINVDRVSIGCYGGNVHRTWARTIVNGDLKDFTGSYTSDPLADDNLNISCPQAIQFFRSPWEAAPQIMTAAGCDHGTRDAGDITLRVVEMDYNNVTDPGQGETGQYCGTVHITTNVTNPLVAKSKQLVAGTSDRYDASHYTAHAGGRCVTNPINHGKSEQNTSFHDCQRV